MRRLTILLATVGALLLVPAAQAFAANTLKVNIAGNGSGEVSSVAGTKESGEFKGSPPIACSYKSPGPATGTCTDTMTASLGGENEELLEEVFEIRGVSLTVTPSPGSGFTGWTIEEGNELGKAFGCENTKPAPSNPCIAYAEIGENAELTATFEKVFPLTIAKTGEGSVISSPKGIECTGAKTGAECETSFIAGSTVTLTASPATGYAFSAWAGCTEHVGLTCKVTLSKASTVKATFVATPSLTIEKAGSGQGKVGATGISCDENCSKASSAVKTGTSVTVKVTSAKGSKAAIFEGGTGSASGCSGESCTFTISENSSVKVKFDPIPTSTLTVQLTGPAKYKGKVTGKGTVKGLTASAINCGSGCTTQVESFFVTDTVTLTAVAGTGYAFAGWEGSGAGTCTGKATPCTVPTNTPHTLAAIFE